MNSFIRHFLVRVLRRRADAQPKLWRILSYLLLLMGILGSLTFSIFSFTEDEFVWYPLIIGISTFALFAIVSRLLYRRYLMETGQLKRTVLNQKKWRTISKLSLLIGILLSLLFSIVSGGLVAFPLLIGITTYGFLGMMLDNQKKRYLKRAIIHE
jgi:hypothetical protein